VVTVNVATYSNMWAASLTLEQHEQTCGYWYTVKSGGSMPHTAFATRAGLDRWAQERGLALEDSFPAVRGEAGWSAIAGEYRVRSHGVFLGDDTYDMGPGGFYLLRPVLATTAVSNGQYTLALITEEHGMRVVNTLNPNVRDRVVFDYHRTAVLMGQREG
jgi:hypothetical protein